MELNEIKRVVCFDFGLSKTGVAVGNTRLLSSSPLEIIRMKHGIPDWKIIKTKIIDIWEPNAFVVGLPINMNGSDSEMSVRAKEFANSLTNKFKIKVFMCDERLSSKSASDLSFNKKKRIDDIAAAIILNQWLESNYTKQ